MLPGNQAEPSGKVAPSLEGRHRGSKSLDHRRGDGADPGHGLQTRRRLVVLGELPQPLVKPGDLAIQAGDMIEVFCSN